MRIIFFMLLELLLIQPVVSQEPTQKEMQVQMQEAINDMKNQISGLEKQIITARKEDPESVKDLEEQLAMLKKQLAMMEGMKRGIPKIPEKTVQITGENNNPGVPKKDISRIKMLPDKILSDAELAGFVKKVHSEVERLMPAEDKKEALKIYTSVKSQKKSSDYTGNVANSLWLSGYPEIALYVLGKECVADMKNDNNLNNYAALLTMAGGAHAAIPVLAYLNKKFPGNSTIHNNLGQAWYGLGDLNNASQFLDSAIKLYPYHAQANITKSEIQESEGKIPESIESLKRSIKENYTSEKEDRLEKLGGKLNYNDIPFRYPQKAEPLGLGRFLHLIPDYPLQGGITAEEKRLEWENFRSKLWSAYDLLKNQINVLEKNTREYNMHLPNNPMLLMPYNSPAHRIASRKMILLYEWASDKTVALDKKMRDAADTVKNWEEDFNKAKHTVEEAHKDEEDRTAACKEIKELATAFLIKANSLWQDRNSEWLNFQKQLLNEQARLALYASTNKYEYELTIARIKENFLNYLANQRCEFQVGCITTDPEAKQTGKLPDFDSLTCQYKDEIFIPPFTTIKAECNRMSTEFDVDTELGAKIKWGWEENLNTGKITKGTLELGYEAGIDHDMGPVKAELKGEGSLGIEINENGIQEVYIKGKASAELTGNIDKPDPRFLQEDIMDSKGSSIVEAETKVSWNAGAKGKPGTINTAVSASGFCNSINIAGVIK